MVNFKTNTCLRNKACRLGGNLPWSVGERTARIGRAPSKSRSEKIPSRLLQRLSGTRLRVGPRGCPGRDCMADGGNPGFCHGAEARGSLACNIQTPEEGDSGPSD